MVRAMTVMRTTARARVPTTIALYSASRSGDTVNENDPLASVTVLPTSRITRYGYRRS